MRSFDRLLEIDGAGGKTAPATWKELRRLGLGDGV